MIQDALETVLVELRTRRSLDFSGYRRGTLQRRLLSRMSRLGIDDQEAYLDKLRSDPVEIDGLVDALAVNVSAFFRDPLVFEILAQVVLPDILAQKKQSGFNDIRVWSAGCAAGEEALSLAIVIQEEMERQNEEYRALVFATDIDGEALSLARGGVYAPESMANVKLGLVDKYFARENGKYRAADSLQAMLQISADDLTSPATTSPSGSVFGDFDLVLCRNVLIYFARELQQEVLGKLYRSLAPGGYLVLGSSESLQGAVAGRLATIDARNRIYRRYD